MSIALSALPATTTIGATDILHLRNTAGNDYKITGANFFKQSGLDAEFNTLLVTDGPITVDNDSGTAGATLKLQRTDTTVADNDDIGAIDFYGGEDGSEEVVGRIIVRAEGDWGAADSATSMEFHTTANAATSITSIPALRLKEDNNVEIVNDLVITGARVQDGSHYLASTSTTENAIFDALAAFIPNTADEIKVNGHYQSLVSPYNSWIVCGARRQNATQILLRALEISGDATPSDGVTITDGGAGSRACALSW